MKTESVRKIRAHPPLDCAVNLPPSKSYTNRAYIAAALASGTSIIENVSVSDDSKFLLSALRQFGIEISERQRSVEIKGCEGLLSAPAKEIFVGNAGTALRFLTSFSALVPGTTRITGDEQMLKRPIGDLAESLREAGISCSSESGYPPVTIHGGALNGGIVSIRGSVSSQFVSSLLLTAPYAKHPSTIHVRGQLRSMPYVNMTLETMRSFGAEVEAVDGSTFIVGNRDRYVGRTFAVETDATASTYFAAAAAVTKGRVVLNGFNRDSLQGDVRFLSILSEMGCEVEATDSGTEIRGAALSGIEIDMNDLPDCVPTLAAVALFARGPTTITNVGHLRFKESDRLKAIAIELRKLGADVELFEDGITIRPGPLHGSAIHTYNDHRIAMSFAVAGLEIPGVEIENPDCVSKSFPDFWSEFAKLEQKE